MAPLNHKQKKFATAYAAGPTAGNAAQSAIAAGYSAHTAHSAGPRLLGNVEVAKLIEAKQAKVLNHLETKGEQVLAELANFAHSDIAEMFDSEGVFLHPTKMERRVSRAIKSLEIHELFGEADPETGQKFAIGRVVKFSLWPKDRGLELLGRNQKLFTDKVELSGKLTLEQLVNAAITQRKPLTPAPTTPSDDEPAADEDDE